ncbi:MAG: hypothetical protein ACR5LC_03490 [Symbiopectobacterium sp.]|uniref:hypothetical protein n=1 Tax=Symbiopectobacterium sp. TaxID=2952789 RepID=UPI003F2B1083
MTETNSRFAYQDARRQRLDRITQHIVVGSGLLVMVALVLIFFLSAVRGCTAVCFTLGDAVRRVAARGIGAVYRRRDQR